MHEVESHCGELLEQRVQPRRHTGPIVSSHFIRKSRICVRRKLRFPLGHGLSHPLHATRLHLCPDLTIGMSGAVHIDIEVSGLEGAVLRIGQLRARGQLPTVVSAFFHWNGNTAILAHRSFVNVRRSSLDALGRYCSTHTLVGVDRDCSGARCGCLDRRNFLIPR